MHPKRSFHMYPRRDNVYEHKDSLNFDMMKTRIFMDRKGTHQDMYLWLAHLVLGMIMPTITFLMATVEDTISEVRAEFIQAIIDKNNSALDAYLAYTFYGMFFVLIATLLTIYVGPGANGSGVAEIMGLLNGINYP